MFSKQQLHQTYDAAVGSVFAHEVDCTPGILILSLGETLTPAILQFRVYSEPSKARRNPVRGMQRDSSLEPENER